MRDLKLKAWDNERKMFVPQGEIIFKDYGDTSWDVCPNDLAYVGDSCHNGEPQTGRFTIIRSTSVKDRSSIELWEGDLRMVRGKLYKLVDDGWRLRFTRNMFEFGENDDIIVDEDSAWISSLMGNIFENHELMDIYQS